MKLDQKVEGLSEFWVQKTRGLKTKIKNVGTFCTEQQQSARIQLKKHIEKAHRTDNRRTLMPDWTARERSPGCDGEVLDWTAKEALLVLTAREAGT
jgi:hypothetical protein